jgi:ribosome-associated protein
MDIKKLQAVVVDALEDVKGQEIMLFDTTHLTALFDRICIVSGTSNRQTKALAASVRDKVKEKGGDVVSMEGDDTGEWVLVDLGDMIVHIMQPAIRQYYRLEEIWGEKPVKLGAAKRKSTAEGQEADAPKAKSKHLAANKADPEAKPVVEKKPRAASKTAAAKTPAAKKPAAKKAVAAGKTVKVAAPKAEVASLEKKVAAKKAAAKTAPVKRVIKRAVKAPAE